MARRRRAPPGTHWKVLAQDESGGRFRASSEEYDFVYDELVVDRWLHLEQTNTNHYWMQVGPLHINVTLKPNGDTDIWISRELADYGGVVTVASNVDTKGERRKAVPIRPQYTKRPVSGWRVPE